MSLNERPASFAVIASWAGCYQVVPFMFASLAARDDMINCHVRHFLAAVLAGVIIPSQDFALAQFDPNARSFDHPFQADNRGTRVLFRYGMDEAATV